MCQDLNMSVLRVFINFRKYDRVLDIWHGCICKGYAEFCICLIIASYASIMPEYASICLNVPQYA